MMARADRLQRMMIAAASLAVFAGALSGCTMPFHATAAATASAVATPAPAQGATPAPDLSPLQAQLEEYLSQQEGTYGVYVTDLASGKGTGINADVAFPAASTFKLPMAMYILDQVARGNARLDEILTYTADDYEDGTGVLQDEVSGGGAFTVRRLVELAITQSDNIATNMLLRRFGRSNVYAYMQQLGGKVTQFDPETNGTTPREMALYMQSAQDSKTIADTGLRRFLLGTLGKTAFADRVAAGVPRGVRVAHKIGTLPGVVNDIALVYAPRRTFIVSVLSMDVSEEVAPAVIAEVARRVYAFEAGQARPGRSRRG